MIKKLKLGANWVTSIVHEQNRNFRAVCFTHCFLPLALSILYRADVVIIQVKNQSCRHGKRSSQVEFFFEMVKC